jgi:hypothetical protein
MSQTKKGIAKSEQDNVEGADGASHADLRPELTDTSKNHQGSSCEVDNATARFCQLSITQIVYVSTHKISEKSMAAVLQEARYEIGFCRTDVWNGQRTGNLEAVNRELDTALGPSIVTASHSGAAPGFCFLS